MKHIIMGLAVFIGLPIMFIVVFGTWLLSLLEKYVPN